MSLFAHPRFHQAVLDALAEHVAILDAAGTIVAVNRSWRSFAMSNGGDERCLTGNYLEICWRSFRSGCAEAEAAAQGIKAVIAGKRSSFELEYPCHAPDTMRYFLLFATPLVLDPDHGGARDGVVVSHIDITRRRLLEEQRDQLVRELAESMERIRLMSG